MPPTLLTQLLRTMENAKTLRIPQGTHREIVLLLTEREHTLDITVEDGATLDIVCIQIADDVDVSIRQQSTLGANAKIHWHNVTLGGGVVKHDLQSYVRGAGSGSAVDWIFYGKGRERQELSVRNIFDAPNGSGEITVHGVAEGMAHCTFDGSIEITERGGGTNTYLTEKILMLDSTAKVDAVPALEIKTNDVKASHSATVTRVSPEDLFYFASRGIAATKARRMFVEGFLGVLVGKIAAKRTREDRTREDHTHKDRTREGVRWEIARKYV